MSSSHGNAFPPLSRRPTQRLRSRHPCNVEFMGDVRGGADGIVVGAVPARPPALFVSRFRVLELADTSQSRARGGRGRVGTVGFGGKGGEEALAAVGGDLPEWNLTRGGGSRDPPSQVEKGRCLGSVIPCAGGRVWWELERGFPYGREGVRDLGEQVKGPLLG